MTQINELIEFPNEFGNTSTEDNSGKSTYLTPVTKCCLKKQCYERVLPLTQNELFNNFWRIGDYAKQNYYLVGLMAAQTPVQVTSRPIKKNKTLSWKYWVDIRGRKVQVCKGFFLAVYGVSDKRLRVLQTKLVNGDPLEDQRGKYDKERRANQHTVKRKLEESLQLEANHQSTVGPLGSDETVRLKTPKKIKPDNNTETVFLNEIVISESFPSVLQTNH